MNAESDTFASYDLKWFIYPRITLHIEHKSIVIMINIPFTPSFADLRGDRLIGSFWGDFWGDAWQCFRGLRLTPGSAAAAAVDVAVG